MLRKIIHTCFIFCVIANAHAQVTLVSPTAEGGFELGTTFAANGWTDVQLGGGAANKWYVGTAAVASGTRGAYISNDGGTSNLYTNTQARTQHFYRDITFPATATSVTISFSWRNEGESCCDYITAYLENTTFTPVSGTINPSTNQIGTEYNVSSTWQTVTINLNCGGYAGTTRRLIFSWRNDGSVGTDPPGALDNISVVAQTTGTACSFAVNSMTYNTIDALNAGTLLAFPDDEHSSAVSIGFPFCFNGVSYSQCVVSSNAYLAFDATLTGSYSEYDTDPIPITTPAYLTNTIMFPWQDVDPSVSGAIRYATYGTAPNRRFVVSFRNVAMYDCNTLKFFGQVKLFETTNEIEMHIQTKTVCSTWNNEEAVQGVNLTCGAYTVPGRNNTSWTATNDAWKFTPVGCCSTVLPADDLDFFGEQQPQANVLRWQSVGVNNQYFVLERSTNGDRYVEIDRQNAVANSGTSHAYAYSDIAPGEGVKYYRLKQVHTDGSFVYSKIVMLQKTEEDISVINVFPNPSSGDVEVDIISPIDTDATIEIYDVCGKMVMNQCIFNKEGLNTHALSTSLLNHGVYHLRVISGKTATVFSEKIVKN